MDITFLKRALLKGKWFISRHARVRAGQRRISDTDILLAIMNGEVLEQYSNDPRGPSCLILGHAWNNKPLHVVCGVDPEETIIIITIYEPEPPYWLDERTRRVSDDGPK